MSIRRARRTTLLGLMAALPWAVSAIAPSAAEISGARAVIDAKPAGAIIFPKPIEVTQSEFERLKANPPPIQSVWTPWTAVDDLAYGRDQRRARALKVTAIANEKLVGSLSDWVSDGSMMRPVFAASGAAAFAAPLSPSVDMGRLTGLRKAMEEHARAKPAGWDALVERAKVEWAKGGERALFRAVDALINDIPYVDGTDGTFFSPARLFSRGGVCKDFVVSKYILLREAGYPAERLRIAVLSPKGPAGEWHVVLMALPQGAKDPAVLDLVPFGMADAALAKQGKTKAMKVALVGQSGINPDEVDFGTARFSLLSVSGYGTRRGLDWAGNELGGAAFAKPLPQLSEPTQFEGQPDGFKAYWSGDTVWLLAGEGPYSLLSARKRAQLGKGAPAFAFPKPSK